MDAISNDVKILTGNWLAHNHLSQVERAYVAADLMTGAANLVRPTVNQAARLARVSNTYVHWAVRRLAERDQITHGIIPLVPYLPAPQLALSGLATMRTRIDALAAELGLDA